jgi:hypothetical protein
VIEAGQQLEMTPVVAVCLPSGGVGAGGDVLASWAEDLTGRARKDTRGSLRFAFYGRVSTEDWQDPVTSRARQVQQAAMLVAGHGGDHGGVLRYRGVPDAAVGAAPAVSCAGRSAG